MMPNTPKRTVRVPDDTWDAAVRIAHEDGWTLSDVIREWLQEYVEDARRDGVL